MHAILVTPGQSRSATLAEVPEPPSQDGAVLVQALAIGVCGTDHEIVEGLYGTAPPGRDRLILGHESIGRVMQAPEGASIVPGDLVVGIVRQPDPVPCSSCAVGEWDMCRNGRYREHGIKERDGFARQRFRTTDDRLVRVERKLGFLGVLLEPCSIVAKAWEQIERIGTRAHWAPRRVLVTGAGPIGLLAALLARQRGFEVHVLDRVVDGPKPELVKALGAQYHTGTVDALCREADIVVECTGVGHLVWEVMTTAGAAGGIVCLAGVSSAGPKSRIDLGALNRELVLENTVVFGTVNANRRHYRSAADALARADRAWLEQLITRKVPVKRWSEALVRQHHDVKTVIEFAD
jgi:glucose 1-dehydrogenase